MVPPSRSDRPLTASIPGSTNPSLIIARLGTTTGLSEALSSPAFTLAPNPTRTTATLTGLSPNETTATLFDGLGRAVQTVPLSAGAATLDVRGLPAGLYTVRIGAAARRLVVE